MVDLIATEDTRQSAKLLEYYGIKTQYLAVNLMKKRNWISYITKFLKEKILL